MFGVVLLAAALGLKDAYQGEFVVGAAVAPQVYESGANAESALVTREFNALTAENEMKPESLQPEEGRFTFETADKLVEFAQTNKMELTGHCLVWHQQTPSWFFVDKDGRDVDRETLIARMRTHIHTVVGRYKGKVKGWDVVNEAYGDDGRLHDSPWLRLVGGDFVELAFRFAHEADPAAELYYNDYGMDKPGKRQGVVELIRTLRAKGIRIDGVGMQSHGQLGHPRLDEYEKSLTAFGAEGVKVMATELDVSVLPAAWDLTADISFNYAFDEKYNPWPKGLPAEKQMELAERYAALFRIYRRHRDVVSRVTFWGVSDRQSWLNYFPVRGRTDYPLPFDRELKAKPCHAKILAVAREKIDVVPCTRTGTSAVFHEFACRGEEQLPPCDLTTQYRNPVLGGMGADPAITRKGDDYYLANSSFSYFPGIPIYHSKNLIDWDFCGYVGNRRSNLKFPKGVGLSAGVFAPDIKYNPHNDTFYLIVTVIGDRGNVVYKTKDPYLGWSEPIPVRVGGIDPSFYFEDDKTAWILNNDDAPDRKPEYDGHRTVRLRKYDLRTDKCVPGTERIVINKGVRPQDKPIWCEGPHLYKIDGRYYLMTAEGGTGGWHSEVMWTADTVEGPYTPCKINPILTQRDLPANRPNPITAAGHADLFQTPDGGWMAVFLAIDPYKVGRRDMCNTGRSTYLLPVKWVGEGAERQPIILDQGKVVPRVVDKPAWMKGVEPSPKARPTAGNIDYSDTFATPALDPGWFALRRPPTFATSGRGLRLEATEDGLESTGTPAYLARWVRNKSFSVQTSFTFEPASEKELAGLCYYQNEKHRYEIGKTLKAGRPALVLRKTNRGKTETVATAELAGTGPVAVRLVSHGKDLTFFYAPDGKTWQPLGGLQDASILSTDHAGGFVAATVGPFVTK